MWRVEGGPARGLGPGDGRGWPKKMQTRKRGRHGSGDRNLFWSSVRMVVFWRGSGGCERQKIQVGLGHLGERGLLNIRWHRGDMLVGVVTVTPMSSLAVPIDWQSLQGVLAFALSHALNQPRANDSLLCDCPGKESC